MGEPDLHSEHAPEHRERVIDVVAVADEREDAAPDVPEPLAHREEIGEGLARVLAQRQAVDHRDRRLGCQLDDDLVRPGPGDDRVDEPLEVPGDVPHALAGAHDDVFGEVHRLPAKLVHAGLERHACPEAGLLEQHREGPPRERRPGRRCVSPAGPIRGLQVRCPVEQPSDLIRREIGNGEQVPPSKARGSIGDGRHAPTVPTPNGRSRHSLHSRGVRAPCVG